MGLPAAVSEGACNHEATSRVIGLVITAAAAAAATAAPADEDVDVVVVEIPCEESSALPNDERIKHLYLRIRQSQADLVGEQSLIGLRCIGYY
ncbi:hypothetical protein V1478_017754 [Vespula squamosa]|uniref:Secreted protein n=1 Tax=Vespula squamosa TaxID=30214 RepID=A0ABD1ZWQ0_VESSQ